MSETTLGHCVELCQSNDWAARVIGAGRLGNYYTNAYARAWLLRMLDDPEPQVSASALSILRLCAGEPEARPVFERIAAGDDLVEARRAQTLLAMFPQHE